MRGDIDFDDDNDESDDAAFLDALRAEFANNGIDLTGDLTVTTLAVDSEWFLDDIRRGSALHHHSGKGSALKVSRGSILNAQAGNEATSNAKNDRVLVDGVAAASRTRRKQPRTAKRKRPSRNSSSARTGWPPAVILATNRASSLTRAFIDEKGFDFNSTDLIDRLLPGDRVRLALRWHL